MVYELAIVVVTIVTFIFVKDNFVNEARFNVMESRLSAMEDAIKPHYRETLMEVSNLRTRIKLLEDEVFKGEK